MRTQGLDRLQLPGTEKFLEFNRDFFPLKSLVLECYFHIQCLEKVDEVVFASPRQCKVLRIHLGTGYDAGLAEH